MLADLLTTMFAKLLGVAQDGSINISKLSDLHKETSKLPPMCNKIKSTPKGGEMCNKVCEMVSQLLDKQEKKSFPFVFCCWCSAKVLTIPVDGDAFLIFCRSPIPHKKYLRKACRFCGLQASQIENLWFELPIFGPRFASKAIAKLKRDPQVSLSRDLKVSVRTLGKAYGRYQFDRIFTDTLDTIASEAGKCPGFIKIGSASRPRKVVPIVRIVTDNIDSTSDDMWPMPVIGFAVERERRCDLWACMQSSRTKAIIEGSLSGLKLQSVKEIRKEHLGEWVAECSIYLKPDTKPEEGWADSVESLAVSGLQVGYGSLYTNLIKSLGQGRLEDFKSSLSAYSGRLRDSFESKEQKNLHHCVFSDVLAVAKRIEGKADTVDNVRRVIGELLNAIQDYPLCMPAPEGQKHQRRQACLRNDVLKGTRNYLTSTQYELRGLESDLHEKSASEARKIILSIYADFSAVLLKWLALGTVYACEVSADIRARAHHTYVKKHLFPGD